MNLDRRSLRFLTLIIIQTIIIVNRKIIRTIIGVGRSRTNFSTVSLVPSVKETVQLTLNSPKYAVSSQLSEIESSASGMIEVRARVEVAGVS